MVTDFKLSCDFFILFPILEIQVETVKMRQDHIKVQGEFTILAITLQPLPQLPMKTRRDKGGIHIFWLTNVNYSCFGDFAQQYN